MFVISSAGEPASALARQSGQATKMSKAGLLRQLAPQYLDGRDAALRDAFFATLATVPSSGDMRSVLTRAALGYAAASPEIALQVVEASLGVASSGDRAAVLIALVDVGALRATAVRDAFMRATEGLSSGDAARALRAAANGP